MKYNDIAFGYMARYKGEDTSIIVQWVNENGENKSKILLRETYTQLEGILKDFLD